MKHRAVKTTRTRAGFLRCRASDEEIARVAKHAEELGYRSTSDYIRDLVTKDLQKHKIEGLPQREVGAPKANQNHKGKPGANQFTKR